MYDETFFLVNNFLFLQKNSIVDGRLGFKEASENNEIFMTKPTIVSKIYLEFTVSQKILI